MPPGSWARGGSCLPRAASALAVLRGASVSVGGCHEPTWVTEGVEQAGRPCTHAGSRVAQYLRVCSLHAAVGALPCVCTSSTIGFREGMCGLVLRRHIWVHSDRHSPIFRGFRIKSAF